MPSPKLKNLKIRNMNMSIKKYSPNDTEARHSISTYPIPIWILPAPQKGITEAKSFENDTGKLQKIQLSIHITVTVGKGDLLCRE